MPKALCYFKADKGTLSSFPRNLRCFAANCNMSRITRLLCFFLGLKFASVHLFYAFSISGPDLGASAKSSLCKSFEEARLENTDRCVHFLAVLDALHVDAPRR